MNCSFLCFSEFSLALYILLAIVFCVIFTNLRSYAFPELLSIITSSSIFVFILLLVQLINISDPGFIFLNGLSSSSSFNTFFQVLLFVTGCFVLFLNRSYYSIRSLFQYEFDLLLIFSFLALFLLCLCNDLLLVYVVLELQSLAFYVLACFWRNSEYSNEAGLRYFIFGAFSSCLLLLSFSFFYLSIGSTSFDTISSIISEDSIKFNLYFFGICLFFAAIFFKLGAVPSHFWVCDVYEGSLINISAFFSIVPKSIIFCLLSKFVFFLFSSHSDICSFLLSFCGILSVFVSSLAALYQKKIKRLLAYSAVGHVGFILIAFSSFRIDSVKSALLYLVIYIIMNLGIFSLLIGFSSRGFLFKYLINWSSLKKWNISVSLAFAILLFSVAGIPPLAGFYSKLNVLLLAVLENRVILSLTLVILSCISCFFYIRLIKILFFSVSNTNNVLFYMNTLKGFELHLTGSFLFVVFFLTKPESLNNLLSFVTLLLIY